MVKVKTTATLGVSFNEDDGKWCGSVTPGTPAVHIGPLDNPRLEGYGYQVLEVTPGVVTNVPEGWADEVSRAKRLVVVCREDQYEVADD